MGAHIESAWPWRALGYILPAARAVTLTLTVARQAVFQEHGWLAG